MLNGPLFLEPSSGNGRGDPHFAYRKGFKARGAWKWFGDGMFALSGRPAV